MGLLSFLFGGDKKAAKARPAARVADKPKAGEKKAAETTKAKGKAPVGVVPLKLAYAAELRGGDAAKAYEAACKLASFYRKNGARALAAEYRAAADGRLAEMLAASAKSRQAKLAARVAMRGRSAKLLGAAQAQLLASHRDFLAGLDRRRA